MLAFDWSRIDEKADHAHTWLEIPFTDASPVHERVALIAVVAATEAAAHDRGWQGLQVGRRQVRAWAASADGIDREALERYLTEAAAEAERKAAEDGRRASMATVAAQKRFVEAKAQAERLAQDIRKS